MRNGSKNGNWKGGISRVKTADQILELPATAIERVKTKFLSQCSQPSGGCWLWTGSIFKSNGRALIVLGSNLLASRVSHVLFKGPASGCCVLHSCDNVLCVNPEHLRLGTQADNSADMVARGRQATGDKNGSKLHPERLVRGVDHPLVKDPRRVQGENNGRALLTNDQVREIRKKYDPYLNKHKPGNRKALAKEFGVKPYVIALIGNGKTWRSVK